MSSVQRNDLEGEIEGARRCRSAPPLGDDPARPTGAVHGSAQLEHGSDCARLPWSVERRGDVPQGEERRRGAVGAVASVDGRIDTPAHLCERGWTDAREFGEDRARGGGFGTQNHGKLGRNPGDAGAYDNRGGGTTADGDAGAGADERAAPRGEDL